MKKKPLNHFMSMLCLVLAMCMALQSTALAVAVPQDEQPALPLSEPAEEDAVPVDETPEADSSAPADEPAQEPDNTEGEPAPDEDAQDPADSSDQNSGDTSSESNTNQDSQNPDPTPEAPAPSTPGLPSVTLDIPPEATPGNDLLAVNPNEGQKNGWTSVQDNGETKWTFWYWPNATDATPTQAKDIVIYVNTDVTVNNVTFKQGYYYFDENGFLVLNSTEVGIAETVRIENQKFVSYTGTTNGGKMIEVSTAQSTDSQGKTTMTSTPALFTGAYVRDDLRVYYSKGELYTGFYRNSSGLFYMSSGLAKPYTGIFSTKVSSTYGTTVFKGDGLYYSNGLLYTGFWINPSTDILYYMTKGVYQRYTGIFSTKITSTYGSETSNAYQVFQGDGLYYSNGSLYTGFWINSSTNVLYYMSKGVYVRYTGIFSTSVTSTYGSSTSNAYQVFKGDGLYYSNGAPYTGFWVNSSTNVLYYMTKGVYKRYTGIYSSSTKSVFGSATSNVYQVFQGDDKYYNNGVVGSGVYNLYYYSNGVKTTNYRGWKTFNASGAVSTKSSDSTYYFNSNGQCVTGWHNLAGPDGTTYRYYFLSDGSLCKDIFKEFSSYKQSKTFVIKVYYSQSSDNTATIFAKDSSGYYIPCKSIAIGTPKNSSNFKAGTYNLTSVRAWLDLVTYQYLWASNIKGSNAWFHSESYTSQNHNTLVLDEYNGLGTNQSQNCIRMQVVNCKLIYDIYKQVDSVMLIKSTTKGPFGRMSLNDNVDYIGKVTTRHDPTDPS